MARVDLPRFSFPLYELLDVLPLCNYLGGFCRESCVKSGEASYDPPSPLAPAKALNRKGAQKSCGVAKDTQLAVATDISQVCSHRSSGEKPPGLLIFSTEVDMAAGL